MACSSIEKHMRKTCNFVLRTNKPNEKLIGKRKFISSLIVVNDMEISKELYEKDLKREAVQSLAER
jgi:hypothetical protein